MGSNTNFYNTSRWQSIRYHFKQSNPLCKHCEQEGIPIIGTQVDHIIPISEGGHPTLWDNLQNLCNKHHSQKTRRENAAEKKPIEQSLSFGDSDPASVEKKSTRERKTSKSKGKGHPGVV